MISILDPNFRYVCAAETDIRKTFERARQMIQQQQAERMPQVFRRRVAAVSTELLLQHKNNEGRE